MLIFSAGNFSLEHKPHTDTVAEALTWIMVLSTVLIGLYEHFMMCIYKQAVQCWNYKPVNSVSLTGLWHFCKRHFQTFSRVPTRQSLHQKVEKYCFVVTDTRLVFWYLRVNKYRMITHTEKRVCLLDTSTYMRDISSFAMIILTLSKTIFLNADPLKLDILLYYTHAW